MAQGKATWFPHFHIYSQDMSGWWDIGGRGG